MVRQRTVREQLAVNLQKELTANTSAEKSKAETGAPRMAYSLVQDAARAGASDIHIEPGSHSVNIRFRIDGFVVDVATVGKTEGQLIINQIKALAELSPVTSFSPRDAHASCLLESGPLDLRLALTPSATGEALSVRLLNPKRLQRAIDDLGLVEESLSLVEEWLAQSTGMFVAAGPTGSGKTTTVYSLLHVLRNSDEVVVTLEDPVEYQIDGVLQVQLDPRHHLNFGEGVKAMLRLDPDYLMLGEIRDGVSARAAVDAAISGRVLLTTLHCRDSVGAVTALRNWGLSDPEIAEALSVVVSQRLVRRLCTDCRRQRPPAEKEQRWFATQSLPPPAAVFEAVGCRHCAHLGYSGRTAIFDLWRLDEPDYDAVLAHADEHSLRRALAVRCHRSLLMDGLGKVATGIIGLSDLRGALSGVTPAR